MDIRSSNTATTTPRTLSSLHLDPLLPLTGGLDGDQRLCLVARAGLTDYLTAQPSIGFTWIEELAPVAVSIDLACLENVDSVLLGWLLRLARTLPEVPMALIGLNPRLRAQLTLLRLDHVFALD